MSSGETIPVLQATDQRAPFLHDSQHGALSRPASTATKGAQHDGSYHPQDPPIRTGINLDEVMKPIVGRGGPPDRPGNNANLFDPASPLSVQLDQQAPAVACTATLDKDPWACPSWDGVETIYPSYTMQYTSVDCKGCDYINSDRIHFCPNMQITARTTVTTASTLWNTVCAKSTGKAQAVQPAVASITAASNPIRIRMPAPAPAGITLAPTATVGLDARQAIHPAACPTTVVVQPEQSAGKTQTTYAKYTTTTVLVNCGGCPLVVTTGLFGYGPPGVFTKTTTVSVGTKTAYACL